MEVKCKICGAPVELPDIPDDYAEKYGAIMARSMRVFASQTCCDSCIVKYEEEREIRDKRAMRESHIKETIAMGDLPVDIQKYRFSASVPAMEEGRRNVWDAARNWRPTDGCLWIWGDRGVGKSHLAKAICWRAVWSVKRAAFITATQMGDSMRKYGKALDENVLRWKQVDVLAIDDFDKIAMNETSFNGMWQLFDVRHGKGLPTIITCEYPPGELGERWAVGVSNAKLIPSILERLRPCTVYEMRGESLRGGINKVSN